MISAANSQGAWRCSRTEPESTASIEPSRRKRLRPWASPTRSTLSPGWMSSPITRPRSSVARRHRVRRRRGVRAPTWSRRPPRALASSTKRRSIGDRRRPRPRRTLAARAAAGLPAEGEGSSTGPPSVSSGQAHRMAGRTGEIDGEAGMADVLVLGIEGEQVGPVGKGVDPGRAPRRFDPQRPHPVLVGVDPAAQVEAVGIAPEGVEQVGGADRRSGAAERSDALEALRGSAEAVLEARRRRRRPARAVERSTDAPARRGAGPRSSPSSPRHSSSIGGRPAAAARTVWRSRGDRARPRRRVQDAEEEAGARRRLERREDQAQRLVRREARAGPASRLRRASGRSAAKRSEAQPRRGLPRDHVQWQDHGGEPRRKGR